MGFGKRLLQVVGVVALVLLLAGITAGVLIGRWGSRLDAESAAYVEEVVPAIIANRSADFLLSKATPEARQVITPDALSTVLGMLNQLGAMTQYAGAVGESNIALNVGSPTVVSANYVARGFFENGTATFQISLRKLDSGWMIHFFHINVDSLTPAQARHPT